jgi:NADP-reducing hydrogenase subunit HndA
MQLYFQITWEEQRMKKTKTCIPFVGTREQEEKLLAVIEQYRNEKGPLMPVLQAAQGIYGYLPIEVQQIISQRMEISLEEIYGVVSFYAQFTLNPKGKYNIAICLGTACYVKGSQEIIDTMTEKLGVKPGGSTEDGLFSFEATRCIGACGLAPVLMVNDEVYGKLVKEDVEKILAKYR